MNAKDVIKDLVQRYGLDAVREIVKAVRAHRGKQIDAALARVAVHEAELVAKLPEDA